MDLDPIHLRPFSVLYIIATDDASVQAFILQVQKQQNHKFSSRYDTCHIESKPILQTPKHLISLSIDLIYKQQRYYEQEYVTSEDEHHARSI